jgi:hypothetical protein
VTRNQWYGVSRRATAKLAKWMLNGSTEFAVSVLPGILVVLDEPVNAADGTQIEPRPCEIQGLVMETEAWMASLG